MKTRISFNGIENTPIAKSSTKNKRKNKGKSLLQLPVDYCIIDIETTGLSPEWDEIIEISSIKCIEGKLIDSFSQLVKPENEIDDFIQSLTGITNEMVKNAEPIQNVLPEFLNFIGRNILVAHNAHFDINFLYDNIESNLQLYLSNDFVDTMRIFRRLHPDLPHHRLQDFAEYYKEEYSNAHRSLNDCQILKKCYDNMIIEIGNQYGDTATFIANIINSKKGFRASDITTSKTDFDISHPLYRKNIVFTGTLERMGRKDAMQIIADLGGINADSVTKKTNYLILGNNDYCKTIKDGKSTKQKKAEKLKLAGNDIEIISENVFYDLIIDSFENE